MRLRPFMIAICLAALPGLAVDPRETMLDQPAVEVNPTGRCEDPLNAPPIFNPARARDDGSALRKLDSHLKKLAEASVEDLAALSRATTSTLFASLNIHEALIRETDGLIESPAIISDGPKLEALKNFRRALVETMSDNLWFRAKEYRDDPSANRDQKAFGLVMATEIALRNPITTFDAANLYLQLLSPNFESLQSLIDDLEANYNAILERWRAEKNAAYKENYERALALISVAFGKQAAVRSANIIAQIEGVLAEDPTESSNPISAAARAQLEKLVSLGKSGNPNWGWKTAKLFLAMSDQVLSEAFEVRLNGQALPQPKSGISQDQMNLIELLGAGNERELRLYAQIRYELQKIEESIQKSQTQGTLVDRFHAEATKQGLSLSEESARDMKITQLKAAMIRSIVENDLRLTAATLEELRKSGIGAQELGPVQHRSQTQFAQFLGRRAVVQLLMQNP